MANEAGGGEVAAPATGELKVEMDPALDQRPSEWPPPPQVPLVPDAEVVELALETVCLSPTDLRKRVRDIDKLAQSIQDVGQLQPILVRRNAALGGYEVVDGGRRRRAFQLLAEKPGGPKTIRATVRELTDLEVDELRLLANLQRDDFAPLEEAEGYGRLETVHKVPRPEIAKRFGKTLSLVHARLQLLKLGPAARRALENEEVNVSVAGEIARCPVLKTQDDILVALKAQGITTHEAALELIRRDFSFSLTDAPFDKSDAYLVPEAGACDSCPHNARNQRQLELGAGPKSVGADVCTNPSCYREKRLEHLKAEKQKAEKDGRGWLTAEEAKKVFQGGVEVAPSSPYVPLRGVCFEDPKKRTWEQLVGTAELKRYVAANPRGRVVEVLDKVEAVAAARKAGRLGKAATELATRNPGAELKARKEDDELESQVADRVLSAGVAAMEEGKDGIHLHLFRLLLGLLLKDFLDKEWLSRRRHRPVEQLIKDLSKMPEPKLRGLLFEVLLSEHAQYLSDPMNVLVRVLKLDRKALEREVKAERQKEVEAEQKKRAEALFEKKGDAAKAKDKPAKKKGAAA